MNALFDCAEIYGILATAAGCANGVIVQKALVEYATAKVAVQVVVPEPKVILPPLAEDPESTDEPVPQLERVGFEAAEVKIEEKEYVPAPVR